MQPSNSPIDSSRVQFVDVLRGFALLGIFAANLLIFSGYTYMTDSQRATLSTAGSDKVLG
jgi:uncharacterized membrane protein YeiB